MKCFKIICTTVVSGAFLSACNAPPKISTVIAATPVSAPAVTRSLYVVSGSCYAGGVLTANPTNMIKSFDTTTKKMSIVTDYSSYSPLDSPIGIANLDSGNIIVSVENVSANTRRLDQVSKTGVNTVPYLFGSLAFNTPLKQLYNTVDGGILVTKTAAIEKITAFRTRYLNAGNSYVNNPLTAACTGMNTALSFAFELPSGKIVIGSAAAAPNNKIAILNASGYLVVGDCLGALAAPTATALPVAGASVSDDTFIIAYASPNAADNQIVSYQYDKNTFNLLSATVVTQLSNPSQIFGVSAMVFDPRDNGLYVANSPAAAEKIEKYTWDQTARTLTRATPTTFLQNVDIPCVSGLLVN